MNIADKSLDALWKLLRCSTSDPLIEQDIRRIPQVLDARSSRSNWADSVAGDMERHYSPGRTWEVTTRAMVQLLELGDGTEAQVDRIPFSKFPDRTATVADLSVRPRIDNL